MVDRVRLLHVYGAPQWHSSVEIVGNSNALTVLRDAIDAALAEGSAKVSVMANDGEGYAIDVQMDDHAWDHPTWEGRPSHYVDPIASGRCSDEWMVAPLRDALRRANVQLFKRGVRPIEDPTEDKHGRE